MNGYSTFVGRSFARAHTNNLVFIERIWSRRVCEHKTSLCHFILKFPFLLFSFQACAANAKLTLLNPTQRHLWPWPWHPRDLTWSPVAPKNRLTATSLRGSRWASMGFGHGTVSCTTATVSSAQPLDTWGRTGVNSTRTANERARRARHYYCSSCTQYEHQAWTIIV